MDFIKPFSQISKNDASTAGGKGASLGEMTQAGILVPPGFVILSAAFERFLEETDLNVEIDAAIDAVDPKEMHTVENASEKIQALILDAQMPADIASDIRNFYTELDAQYVAVRSSATAEDSASAAWAGQLDSFLNTTEETLLKNVQRCWASLFTPRAIFYRFEKELHTTKISVAVVVQKMVESEYSGIAFSVHPVTEDRNQLIIEAGFGLGEAVVSGSVTPDSYVVEKSPRRIIDTNVSTQTRALYRVDSGGNEWKDISEPQASSQVLTEKQVLELSELILRIENHYGFPCDIEWAFEKGKFYITQSRPITTLQSRISLTQSLANKFLNEIGNDKLTLIEADLIPLFIIIDWLNYYDRDGSLGGIYPFFYFKEGRSSKVWLNLTKYHDIAKMMLSEYLDKHLDLEVWMKRYGTIEQRINTSYAAYFENPQTKEATLLARLKEADDELREIVALTLFLDMFDRSNVQEVLAERRSVIDLSKIWELSELQDFPSFDVKNKEAILDSLRNGMTEMLQYVFANYTSVPTPKEIAHILSTYTQEAIAKEIAEAKEQIAKNKEVRRVGMTALTPEEREVLTFVDWASALRDHRKALMNKCDVLIFNLTTDLYREWGVDERLVPVSFVFDILKGKKYVLSIRETIEKRLERFAVIYYGKDRYEEDAQAEITELNEYYLNQNKPQEEDVLVGETACRGVVKGTVKVITTQSEFGKLNEGDILVTGMTRPEFVPLMKIASAIVTDEGGITSHAAIVSRELNKPCVIGTKIATKVLKDGDEVEVDADNGMVRIMGRVKDKEDYVFAFGAEKIALNQMEAEMRYFTDNRFKYFSVENGMLFFQEEKMDAYFGKGDIEGNMPAFGKRYLDERYLKDYLKDLHLAVKATEKFYERIWDEDFLHYTDRNISETYAELYELIGSLFGFLNSTGREVMQPIEDKLVSLLKESFGDTYTDVLSLLTTPDELDDIKKERLDWYMLLAKKNSRLSDEDILTHSLQYCWMFPDEMERDTAVRFFRKRLAEEDLTKESVGKSIVQIKEKQNELVEKKRETLFIVSKEIAHLSSIVSALTLGRMDVKIFYGVNFVASKLIAEICQRMGEIPHNFIYHYSLADVLRALETKETLTKAEIEERKRSKLLLIQNGVLSFLSGSQATKKFSELLSTNFDDSSSLIHGAIANKGYAKGKVRIVAMSDLKSLETDTKRFNAGDILVTTMTQPNMMSIAKKAGAIVTDQGGITCHASIISREFNIPCVIGCNFATKILKDGDLVEVDANNGLVRILK